MGLPQQWLIYEHILSDLRTRFTWGSFDEEIRVPDTARIVGQYMPYRDEPDELVYDLDVPAVIVSPPKQVAVGGRLNGLDDVEYPFLIQVVDRDFNRFLADRQSSWLKWQEQVRRYFIEGTLRSLAGVQRVTVDQSWIDRRLFRPFKNAVFATVLVVESREGRDA